MMTAAIRTPTGFLVSIDLIDNKPPLSANQRLYWRRKAEVTKAVRETTAWRVKSLNLPPATRLTVQLRFDTGDNRKRRDPANLCATSKPAIDGVVDSGLVPDDTPEWVEELMPAIRNGTAERGMWLEVTIHSPVPEEAA
jgi:crossover junction endodeoxyribonuclease RusA